MAGMRHARLALAAVLLAATSGCGSGTYSWGWYVVSPFDPRGRKNLQFLLDGLLATVTISVTAIAIAVVAGAALAMLSLSRNKMLRAAARVYVEGVRSIPLLVLLLWVYYGLPVVLGIQFGVFAAGVISLAVSDAAFEAEIFRAGIQSVNRGQWQAASALGLSRLQTLRLIVLPQAMQLIIPAVGNQFIAMQKDSSLVSVMGVWEITYRANRFARKDSKYMEMFLLAAAIYWVLTIFSEWLLARLEGHMARSDMR